MVHSVSSAQKYNAESYYHECIAESEQSRTTKLAICNSNYVSISLELPPQIRCLPIWEAHRIRVKRERCS
jgi:hypothetical protein